VQQDKHDIWAVGNAYKPYVGCWSRVVAKAFVGWLGLEGGRWLDVGCGTGALSQTILAVAQLSQLFTAAGLHAVEVQAIDVPTVFRDFDDYWSPFLGGQGPAPGYAMSLPVEERNQLREAIRAGLPVRSDGSIALVARAWAVRGRRE
jgi:hypothetical protein